MPHQQPILLSRLMCLAIAFALLFLLLVSFTTWAYAQMIPPYSITSSVKNGLAALTLQSRARLKVD